MDDIFDFIQRYWWLVGIIILRAVVSGFGNRKKDKASRSAGADNRREKRKSQLQEFLDKARSDLSASEEKSSQSLPREVPFTYDDADESAFLGHPSVRATPKPKKIVEKKYVPLSETYKSMEPSETTVPVNSVEKKSFPENLNYLPPLRRAFVFSEIFGSPKGLD